MVVNSAGGQQFTGQPQNPYAGSQNPQPVDASGQQSPEQYRTHSPAHSSKKSKSRTALLVVGGIIVLVIAASFWGIMGDGVDADGPWHHHVAGAGEYEADFPERPEASGESMPTPLGPRELKRARCVLSGVAFEVAYFDFGEDPSSVEFDYDLAAKAMAEDTGAVLAPENTSHSVAGYEGRIFSLRRRAGRETRCLILRRNARVYVVSCEEFTPAQKAAADRFISSFKLVEQSEQEP